MENSTEPTRRGVINRFAIWFMGAGLFASYGALAAMGARYLMPARARGKRWLYTTRVDAISVGNSIPFRMPSGERITIARQGESGDVDDFVALSSTCPHLGCQVHWEGNNDRFFCPCHNGVFSRSGEAVSGPPADAGQDLSRYPLKIEEGLLFVHAPLATLPAPGGRRS